MDDVAGRQRVEQRHKVKNRVRLMQRDMVKCELKHQLDIKGFKAGLLSSRRFNAEWHCGNYSN